MEAWLSIVLRQIILYSLPVLISLTCISLLESRLCRKPMPHPFFAISWRGSWLPLLAAIAFHRGMLIAPTRPLQFGPAAAAIRFFCHVFLCILGFLLYAWSLHHQAPAGLPPLHHWWAKVFMFFNLCMAAMHFLPLPHFFIGEWLVLTAPGKKIASRLEETGIVIGMVMLAASPLLDWLLGSRIVFPVYKILSSLAYSLF